jgi:hypothetical protein
MQIWSGRQKTDEADAITLLKRKDYSIYIFCNLVVNVIDDEWEVR